MRKQICVELGNPHGAGLPELDRAPGPSGHKCVGLLLWVKKLNHCLQ